MREISRAVYGIKISWRDRDALISIDGMRDSFEIDSGMCGPFGKAHGIGLKFYESGRMAG